VSLPAEAAAVVLATGLLRPYTIQVVSRVDVTAGPARYDPNLAQHHHFVCSRCGLIRDVYHHAFDSLEAPDLGDELGRVESVRVQLRGLCKRCQEVGQRGRENPDHEDQSPERKESQDV
jgi:Fur family peroxide stress response transcriptional regulator